MPQEITSPCYPASRQRTIYHPFVADGKMSSVRLPLTFIPSCFTVFINAVADLGRPDEIGKVFSASRTTCIRNKPSHNIRQNRMGNWAYYKWWRCKDFIWSTRREQYVTETTHPLLRKSWQCMAVTKFNRVGKRLLVASWQSKCWRSYWWSHLSSHSTSSAFSSWRHHHRVSHTSCGTVQGALRFSVSSH